MTPRCFLALVVVAAACGTPTVPIPPLLDDDFTLAGVPIGMDTTQLRLTYGDPDSIVSIENPADVNVPIIEWHFDGFRAQFIGTPTPNGYLITARTEATARGVRVGDPAAAVIHFYGKPMSGDDEVWRYIDPADPAGQHVVDFLVQTDTVRRIYLGWLVK